MLYFNIFFYVVVLHYRRLFIYVSQQNGSFESWATETEIIAAAYRYNIDMFVHKVINNEVHIMKFPMDDECNHNKQLMFVKNYNDHFDFVRTYVRPLPKICSKNSVQTKLYYFEYFFRNSRCRNRAKATWKSNSEIRK